MGYENKIVQLFEKMFLCQNIIQEKQFEAILYSRFNVKLIKYCSVKMPIPSFKLLQPDNTITSHSSIVALVRTCACHYIPLNQPTNRICGLGHIYETAHYFFSSPCACSKAYCS